MCNMAPRGESAARGHPESACWGQEEKPDLIILTPTCTSSILQDRPRESDPVFEWTFAQFTNDQENQGGLG